MFFEKNDGYSYSPKVLVAPLDWGLGHATRCIPIIYSLLNNGATVFIAADGPVRLLLEKELPQASFLPLSGYGIQYSRRGKWFSLKLFLQFPRIFMAIYKEHRWLKRTQQQHVFDLVISDNRPGLFNRNVTCIYITHQLAIKTGNSITAWLAQKIHYRFITQFDHCWVPDNQAGNLLAGELSHPTLMPRTEVTYTGALSRFSRYSAEKKYALLVLLSGPEPQRSIFETTLLIQLEQFTQPVIFIRGLPAEKTLPAISNKNIEIHNHLDSIALNQAILQSEIILSRSGYTTVMDLAALQKKAILVATPGQTEQEYLSQYLLNKKMFFTANQENFVLAEALQNAAVFPFAFTQNTVGNTYKKLVSDILQSLKNQ